MHGNVWEWVEDAWHSSYQGAPADGSVWQGGDMSLRVLRGGSWASTQTTSARPSASGPSRPTGIYNVRLPSCQNALTPCLFTSLRLEHTADGGTPWSRGREATRDLCARHGVDAGGGSPLRAVVMETASRSGAARLFGDTSNSGLSTSRWVTSPTSPLACTQRQRSQCRNVAWSWGDAHGPRPSSRPRPAFTGQRSPGQHSHGTWRRPHVFPRSVTASSRCNRAGQMQIATRSSALCRTGRGQSR